MATIYFTIYASATPDPTDAQIKLGMAWGSAVAAGSATSPTTSQTYSFPEVTTLSASTAYKVKFLWSDGATDVTVAAHEFSTLSGAVNATGDGALAGITISPATGAATGEAVAAGSLAGATVSPAAGTATGGATASGALASVTIAPTEGSANAGAVNATAVGALASLTVSPAIGGASGAAEAAGLLASVTISPASGAATAGATASGVLSEVTISPPQSEMGVPSEVPDTLPVERYLAAYLNQDASMSAATGGDDYLRLGERIARRRGLL